MIEPPVKLLLVDDTAENLVALDALLRRDGVELLKARSGPQALELLLVHEVALAILDVQMPDMNGFELAELMRGAERTRHIPIIFLTAGARDPHRVFKGYEAGAVDFLFKPIDPHILKSKTEAFLELHRHKAELARNLQMNEMFVGILGHDLRTPLSSIMTGAQLLQRQVGDPAQLKTLGRMLSSAGRMRDMIDQLLDLTRARLADGSGMVAEREPVDVAELVTRAVDELHPTAADRRLAVTVEADGRCDGDATRLLQVFSNLLSNAIHHGTPGTPIVVTVDGGDGDPGEVRVVVRNEGAIPPELLPRIFDPFRGGRTPTRSRGLGLGLFITQQLVEAHGGRITVESSAAAGTAFTVTLPRSAEAVRPQAREAFR